MRPWPWGTALSLIPLHQCAWTLWRTLLTESRLFCLSQLHRVREMNSTLCRPQYLYIMSWKPTVAPTLFRSLMTSLSGGLWICQLQQDRDSLWCPSEASMAWGWWNVLDTTGMEWAAGDESIPYLRLLLFLVWCPTPHSLPNSTAVGDGEGFLWWNWIR